MTSARYGVFVALALAALLGATGASASPCGGSTVRGPVISGADIGAVQRAVVVLPAVGTRQFPMGIGAIVPRGIEVKPVPSVVVKLLPQYAGYRAFRSGFVLMIVNPRSRRISYRFPLRTAATEAC